MSLFSGIKKLFGFGKSKPQDNELAGALAFRDRVVEAIKASGLTSDITLSEENPLSLFVKTDDGGEGEMDLTNGYKRLLAYPHESEDDYVAKYVGLIQQSLASTATVQDDKIVAVVRAQPYINQVRDLGAKILTRPLVGDLHTIFMIDTPDALRAITSKDAEGKTDEDIEALALENMRDAMMGLTADESMSGMTLYYIEDNHFLTSGLILLEEFWSEVSRKYGEAFIFIVPRVDQIMVFDAQAQDVVETAKKMVDATFADNFNLLSRGIYTHHEGVIRSVA